MSMNTKRTAIAAAVAAGLAAACLAAGDVTGVEVPPAELARRQARSVHLRYGGQPPEVSGAAVTVTVREAHPGSYFMALGWSCGYCGIQELSNGAHVLIFSVWDPVDPYDFDAKPGDVREDLQAKVLYADPAMHVSRFGGEGTGAKTMSEYNWKVGENVRFKVETSPDGLNRTAFTCYLRDSSSEGWRKLASISTMNRHGMAPDFGQLHSFVEDFRRNYDSAKRIRRAEFSDVQAFSSVDGKWHTLRQAHFTADPTPSDAVDAGPVAGRPDAFFLATGGSTTNATVKLWSRVVLPERSAE